MRSTNRPSPGTRRSDSTRSYSGVYCSTIGKVAYSVDRPRNARGIATVLAPAKIVASAASARPDRPLRTPLASCAPAIPWVRSESARPRSELWLSTAPAMNVANSKPTSRPSQRPRAMRRWSTPTPFSKPALRRDPNRPCTPGICSPVHSPGEEGGLRRRSATARRASRRPAHDVAISRGHSPGRNSQLSGAPCSRARRCCVPQNAQRPEQRAHMTLVASSCATGEKPVASGTEQAI